MCHYCLGQHNSQVPRHLISDAHEWMNEFPMETDLDASAGKEDPVELDSSLTFELVF